MRILILFFAFLVLPAISNADKVVSGQILVKAAGAHVFADLLPKGVRVQPVHEDHGIYLVKHKSFAGRELGVAAHFQARSGVDFAEPNYELKVEIAPPRGFLRCRRPLSAPLAQSLHAAKTALRR